MDRRARDTIVLDIVATAARTWWHGHMCTGCRRVDLHRLPVATAAVEPRAQAMTWAAA